MATNDVLCPNDCGVYLKLLKLENNTLTVGLDTCPPFARSSSYQQAVRREVGLQMQVGARELALLKACIMDIVRKHETEMPDE